MDIDFFGLMENKLGVQVSAFPAREDAWYLPASKLLEPGVMGRLLDEFSPRIRSADRTTAATYFAGYFGGVALALQLALSLRDVVPDLSLGNLEAAILGDADKAYVRFRVVRWQEQGNDGTKARKDWCAEALSSFYRNEAMPLIASLSSSSGLHPRELWGQMPTRFRNAVVLLQEEMAGSENLLRLNSDYSVLREGLEPVRCFGLPRNPFQSAIRLVEPLKGTGKPAAIKAACCLYYKTDGGSFCYTCPRLKEEERAARRAGFAE
ncbi:(2Fe-2S)-binding protein [Cohnella thailandensis]|uniref:(2Fe-2S)-binding protein n=1 Tax=Cohnella thailandensis TaxID=557557 RepID=A0A841SV03_9BACL|nr:(2Fe-2S)-binding protein [Cohnella thailandensis]MBB6633700.1 (2Fe-2S)-binding protein [Cohnella thailandensis]MBP1976485.1 ferric iron reductase protein FhuF [Cohnella thailandensis]